MMSGPPSYSLNVLMQRRSVKAKNLIEPGPSDMMLQDILRASMRVPDHGMLAPWRYVIVERQQRPAFGKLLRRCYESDVTEPKRGQADALEQFVLEAPCLIVLLSRPDAKSPIPVWEQQLSAGAACMMLLSAAHASGFAGVWLTGPAAYCASLPEQIGHPDARVAGFFFLGTPSTPPEERPRPDPSQIISYWRPEIQSPD